MLAGCERKSGPLLLLLLAKAAGASSGMDRPFVPEKQVELRLSLLSTGADPRSAKTHSPEAPATVVYILRITHIPRRHLPDQTRSMWSERQTKGGARRKACQAHSIGTMYSVLRTLPYAGRTNHTVYSNVCSYTELVVRSTPYMCFIQGIRRTSTTKYNIYPTYGVLPCPPW